MMMDYLSTSPFPQDSGSGFLSTVDFLVNSVTDSQQSDDSRQQW